MILTRVLVVDDEYYARKAVVKMVSEWKPEAQTEEAENGQQALERFLAAPHDMVLMDVRMPLMDGLTLCRRIRETASDAGIVIISGYADFSYAQQAIRYGVEEYILKPVTRQTLFDALQRVYQNRQSGGKPPANPADTDDTQGIVEKTLEHIRAHYAEDLRLTDIAADVVFVNASYLSRCIKAQTGQNFSMLLQRERVSQAKRLLEEDNRSVSDVAATVGYSKVSYFIEIYKRIYGNTPGKERKQ